MSAKTKKKDTRFIQMEGGEVVTLWCANCKQGRDFDFFIPVTCVLTVNVDKKGELHYQNFDYSTPYPALAESITCEWCQETIWTKKEDENGANP